MGSNDHIDEEDDWDVSSLPKNAFATTSGSLFEPDNDWLKKTSTTRKLVAMRAWFRTRYWDPANDTPYNSREGGYLFVSGGPYSPRDELEARFGAFVDSKLIDKVIDELETEVGDQWAPIHVDYDDDYGVDVNEPDEPLDRLIQRCTQNLEILKLEGDEKTKALAQKLVFVAMISALESFLWETVAFFVEHDSQVRMNIVEKTEAFKNKPLKLGNIFKQLDALKDEIKAQLQNQVWHNWRQVAPLFTEGIGIDMPSFSVFNDALLLRHDISHRSGFTKDGVEVVITEAQVLALSEQVTLFAKEVHQKIASRVVIADF